MAHLSIFLFISLLMFGFVGSCIRRRITFYIFTEIQLALHLLTHTLELRSYSRFQPRTDHYRILCPFVHSLSLLGLQETKYLFLHFVRLFGFFLLGNFLNKEPIKCLTTLDYFFLAFIRCPGQLPSLMPPVVGVSYNPSCWKSSTLCLKTRPPYLKSRPFCFIQIEIDLSEIETTQMEIETPCQKT